jgi:RNA-directed DNA polymerase
MKLVSWNVNGIRAAWNHGLSAFLDSFDADIYCFQETKTDEAIPEVQIDGYYAYWSFCQRKKGYSGTLCLTKFKPIHVSYTLGDDSFDAEGRIITLEYPDFFLVNCYVPNSQHSKYRADYRSEWDLFLLSHLCELKYRKPTIVCGDFNVPISDEDIYAESKWVGLNAEGFQSAERENLLQIIEVGFLDSYRLVNPEETGKYTWWSNRRGKRSENRGWRLDYFLVSDKLANITRESSMCTEIMGSDHCPIFLEIDLPPQGETIMSQYALRETAYTYHDLVQMQKDPPFLDYIKRTDMTGIWNSIDWEAAEKRLATMQMALAKSAYSHDWDLITKWQKNIVYSLDAKVLAVRHVCSRSSSAGIDCIKWTTPHEKMSAALSLTAKGYRAMPSRLLLVKSKNGKQRRIHLETYYDCAMQTLYAYALDPVAESWGDRKSFAYRKGRSAFDMNEYIKSGLSGYDAPQWLFIGDVHKCYETISHEWILNHIPMAENVLREFLKAGYVFAGEMFPTDIGIGIGCTMSPIIANMVLDGLQEYVYAHLYPGDAERDYADGNLIRYADDIIITARTRDCALKIRLIVTKFLEERGLALSEEKSRIIHIADGFEFMSRRYEKRGIQVYCKPSTQSIERFMNTIRDTITGYKGSQKALIEKVNKKIDGYVSYQKVGEAEAAFRQLDVYISALLLDLCESKHPKWTREKILEKYWYIDSEGRHCYALPDKREVRVKSLADALCVDYTPVKTNMNPYIDLGYLEMRTKNRQMLNATGVYRAIWNRQDGKCHYCGRKILRDEEKSLIEVDASQTRFTARNAYVHRRCLDCSIDYIDTDVLPSSVSDVMDLLKSLDGKKKSVGQRYLPLSEFFRTCDKNSVTMTFKQIETLLGEALGATAQRKEFWYRTGFTCISQCWLDNGYEIKRLHLEGRQRVVFHLTATSKNTASVKIPEVIKYGRIPIEAKYELENYFKYIVKKYGL